MSARGITAWPLYRALVGTGMICGLLIAVVFETTRPRIVRNHAEALERAVFSVLPGAIRYETFTADAAGRLLARPGPGETSQGSDRMHAGFDDRGRLVGIAVEASGMGYADTISLLYAYAPAEERIVGLRILASRETPGLGDRIGTDPQFLANFEALDARLDGTGQHLMHAISAVKHGAKSAPWQIDAITGATVSSNAVADILQRSTAYWLPLVHRQIDAIVPQQASPPPRPQQPPAIGASRRAASDVN